MPRHFPKPVVLLVVAAIAFFCSTHALAQELEPRAYSLSPVGTNFFGAALGRSTGGIIFDPSIPITDASAQVDIVSLYYGRTYGLGSRLGTFTVAVPAAVAHAEGMVGDASRDVRRRGFVDMRLRASVLLLGGRAMTREEFAKAPRKTTLGLSLTVQVPNGQYEPTRLINLGTNRWAFKPELGLSVPVARWAFEVYGGAWFFARNDEFYPGTASKSQDPLTSVQTHVSYTFKNRAWLAFDATWYGGGQVTIDQNPPASRLSNSRVGGTFSIPVAKTQSIKLAASRGTSVRTGSNFDTYLVAWQLVWFDKPKKKAGE